MAKKSKKTTARTKKSEFRVGVNVAPPDEWEGVGPSFEAKLIPTFTPYSGGWREGFSGRNIFTANFETEPSCCGIPVMTNFWKHRDCGKHIKEIGKSLKKYLIENCEYMSAYIPEKSSYKIEMKILKAAGFKSGLSLKSRMGRYNNHRMEWKLQENRDEAVVAPIAV